LVKSAGFVVALLGLPIINVLSVANVGGATGATIIGAPTGLVVSTKISSLVQDDKNITTMNGSIFEKRLIINMFFSLRDQK
jgi:hypothetical protein